MHKLLGTRLLAIALVVICACGRAQDVKAAKTTALQNDLFYMRKSIRDFREDKHRPPRDLNELVAAHYLRVIPKDPMTGAADWRVVTEESVNVDEFKSATSTTTPARSGIVDVHSSAPGHDANGKAWSEY